MGSVSKALLATLAAALLLFAGCKALKVEHAGVATEGDWLTEGFSAQRSHATEVEVEPPLEQAWVYNAGAAFGPGSPLLLGNAVLVATRKGEIHAIEFETGKRIGVDSFGDLVEGTPVIQNGVMFIPVGWGRRSLYAYDLSSGNTRWKLKGEPIATGLLALDDGFVAVDAMAWVRRYDPTNGAVLWEQALGDRTMVHTTPVLAGERIVVVDDRGEVVALDPADGSIQWREALSSPVYTSIAADETRLFVPSTRGRFFVLDAEQGRVLWDYALPDTTVHFTTPAVDGSLVVVGASDGTLRAFDADTGAIRWTFHNDAALRAAPLLTPHTVYVGSMAYSLFAIDRETGDPKWEQQLRGRVKSALVARDGYLVVLSEPRFVYLFKSSSAVDDVVSP